MEREKGSREKAKGGNANIPDMRPGRKNREESEWGRRGGDLKTMGKDYSKAVQYT